MSIIEVRTQKNCEYSQIFKDQDRTIQIGGGIDIDQKYDLYKCSYPDCQFGKKWCVNGEPLRCSHYKKC